MRFGTSVRLSIWVLLAIVVARGASAQTRVVGTVIDDAGKAVKAATITAQHPDTGQTFTATTDVVADMDLVRAFYADKRGIHPERRTEPRLREELTARGGESASA